MIKYKNIQHLNKLFEETLKAEINFNLKKNIIKMKLELRKGIETIEEYSKELIKKYEKIDENGNKKYTKTQQELNFELSDELSNEKDITFDENLLIKYDEKEMSKIDSNILENLIHYGIITDFE